MIDVDKMCDDFEACLGWHYVSPGSTGKDASSGIDCSGMFVRAFRLQGSNMPHGSNTIWRQNLLDKGRLDDGTKLKKGMALFKWSSADTAKYSDGLGDFHHIGLVTNVDPLIIVHASSAAGRVTVDYSTKHWSHWGLLKGVNYDQDDQEEQNMVQAIVHSDNELPVNMRKKPNKNGDLIYKVPYGSTVIVEQQLPGWCLVTYKNHTGYMMTEYLQGMQGSSIDDRVRALEEQQQQLMEQMAQLMRILAGDERQGNGG